MEKDEFLLKRIRELANLSYQRDIVTFSDFLNLNQQNMLYGLKLQEQGVCVETFGGYPDAERCMAVFHPKDLNFSWEYPIDCFHISPKAFKFSQSLTHRDYLGAILNLGVDRSVVGDILVQENEAWVFCQKKMTEFFLENLCRIKHTMVVVEKCEHPSQLPSPRFETISATCSSVRLDALIAAAFRASRSSMVPSIEKGLVFVNGRLITSNGYEPKKGDIISVRGQGRFIFDGVQGQTKKGRNSITLRRYI